MKTNALSAETRDEIIAAVEAADLHSPEQVCDLVIAAAECGQEWQATLAGCILADASEARRNRD